MKKYTGFFSFILFILLCFNMVTADAENKASVYFRWAVLHNTDKEEYKIFFQPLNPCFYYLIKIQENGNIVQILPEDFHQLLSAQTVYKKYFLPGGKQWFKQNKGDICYLLVSTTALESLEKAIEDYFYFIMISPRKKDVIELKSAYVLKTIRFWLTQSVLGDVSPVKSESILGVFRDTDSQLEQSAEKIEVKELYGCKITF